MALNWEMLHVNKNMAMMYSYNHVSLITNSNVKDWTINSAEWSCMLSLPRTNLIDGYIDNVEGKKKNYNFGTLSNISLLATFACLANFTHLKLLKMTFLRPLQWLI